MCKHSASCGRGGGAAEAAATPAGLPRTHPTEAAGRVGREAVEHCCLRRVREAAAPGPQGIMARAAAESPGLPTVAGCCWCLQAVAGCCCCLQAVADCCCCSQAVAGVPCCCRQAEEACQSCQAVVGCPGLQVVVELYCRCQVVVELHHCCQVVVELHHCCQVVVVACRKLQMAGSCRGRQAVGQPYCCQAAEACRSRLKVGECRGCRLTEGLCCARLVEVCGCQTAVGACRRSLQEAKGAALLHTHPLVAGTGCAAAVDCASQRLEAVCGRGSSGWVGWWVGGDTLPAQRSTVA